MNKKISPREVLIRELYNAIDDDLYDFSTEHLSLFESLKYKRYSSVARFAEIEIFVDKLASSEEQAYRVAVDEKGRPQFKVLPLGQYFQRLKEKCALFPNSWGYSDLGYWISGSRTFFWKGYVLSEYVTVFLEALQNVGLTDFAFYAGFRHYFPEKAKYGADLANDLVLEIRRLLGEPDRKKRIRARIEQSQKNFESNEAYIDALFSRASALSVIRIDLFYKREYAASVSPDEAREHRKKLFNNTRGKAKIFGNLEGYVSKLEYGEERGHHFHIIFFFGYSDRFKDGELAWKIGQYWRDCVTSGRGDFRDCTGSKNKYKYLGTGMVKRHGKKRKEILLALTYLTNKDIYLKVQYFNRCRVMDRGEMPKVKPESRRLLGMTPLGFKRIRRTS